MKIINKQKRTDKQDIDNQIVDMLAKILCDEIISYHAYSIAAKNVKGNGWLDVKGEFEQHAETELKHYESIINRLYQLGANIPTSFKDIPTKCGYYWDVDTNDTKKAVGIAKVAEEHAVQSYRDLLIYISNQKPNKKDFATQKLAKQNLENEEDHYQDMIRLELDLA